jgi:hypothetical protein
VVRIGFIRWLLGRDRPDDQVDVPVEVVPQATPAPSTELPALVATVACPYCAVLLEPPPERTRLCPRCRRRIVVRHVEGRAVYLTEAAVEVFEGERRNEVERETWTRERRHWLDLARLAGVPPDRRRRLAGAALTAATVQQSRTLYLAAAERAVRAARRDKHWDDVARIRSRQAAALYQEAGGNPPPQDEIVALYREGVAATLRAIAPVARDAELVGASCCPACRADNEDVFRIADELRVPRLPHPGCPRGLCACDYWPALPDPAKKRRRRRVSPAGSAVPVPGPSNGEQ